MKLINQMVCTLFYLANEGFAAVSSGAPFEDDFHWAYSLNNGPKVWPSKFPTCGGHQQSPVHIKTGDVIGQHGHPFQLNDHDIGNEEWNVTNNGHTVVVSAPNGYSVKGGGLSDTKYNIEQFHFHWGSRDSIGSEHVIDYMQFPIELHVATLNARYTSFSDAAGKDGGVAVLSVLFKVDLADNTALKLLVDELPQVRKEGSISVLKGFSLRRLVDHVFQGYYYRYQGSMTTPPCGEKVTWSVFWDNPTLSPGQLDAFRMLLNHEGRPLVDNFRPSQPVNNRAIDAVIS